MKTILAPLDFSEVTPKVIDATLGLARDLGAKVLLLHVVPPPIVMAAYGLTSDQVPAILLREQEQAEQKLDSCRKHLESEGIEVSILTVQGAPVDSILFVAREHEADLLIIGSHGHGAFYEFIVGSTTRGVLKGFPGPVVIVPSQSAHREERAAS